MRDHPLYQLSASRLREMFREPEMVFWVFVFPILLALALGIAFGGRGGDQDIRVGVREATDAEWYEEALSEAAGIQPEVLDEPAARRQLRSGKVSLVVIPGNDEWTYWFDPTRQDSRLARLAVDDALQRAAGREPGQEALELEMTEKGGRYIDFLIPGLLGMNLLGTGMWGVGFYVVNARQKRLLKRLVATPMRRSHYLFAQMLSRLVFLVVEVGVLLAFGYFAFGVPIRGSLVTVAMVSAFGALTFSGMGLALASRTQTLEGIQGLINVAMLPMWVLSGIFFSTSRFPDWLQPVIQALPLTAVNDALRAVMLDGASLWAVAGELLICGVWGGVSFVLALVLFRWT
jgi:ABC-type multidrug transport system permease subunit